MSDNKENLVRIGLDIKDGKDATEAGIPQAVISLAVNPDTGILHVAAFHYPANEEGARVVADILRTAADGIDRELGVVEKTYDRETQDRMAYEDVASRRRLGETVRDVEKREARERATETFMGQPAMNSRFNPASIAGEKVADTVKRPRFNPKPRGGE